MMKTCRTCGESKSMGDFPQNSGMADRRLNDCKACHRRKHSEKLASDPEWRERVRERKRMAARRYECSPRDKVKVAARNAVNHAIRDGKITPPEACEECGHDFTEFQREAHHVDYSSTLAVRWLCALCHGKRHRKAS